MIGRLLCNPFLVDSLTCPTRPVVACRGLSKGHVDCPRSHAALANRGHRHTHGLALAVRCIVDKSSGTARVVLDAVVAGLSACWTPGWSPQSEQHQFCTRLLRAIPWSRVCVAHAGMRPVAVRVGLPCHRFPSAMT